MVRTLRRRREVGRNDRPAVDVLTVTKQQIQRNSLSGKQ
jgi:hypothetical protein